MDKNIKNALVKAVCKTFQELSFIDVVETNQSNDKLIFNQILYIEIIEPEEMRIFLYLPLRLKEMIAENVYCKSLKNLKYTEIDDCQLEILNVITGNFLSNLYHEKKNYKFELPRILFDDKNLHFPRLKKNELFFDAEDIIFKIDFYN